VAGNVANMDSSDIASIIISAFALALSLGIILLELHRHFRRLHIVISLGEPIDFGIETAYILLNIVIVNTSYIAKTIYRIQFQPLGNFQISEVPGVQDFATALVTYRPLGETGRAIAVRLEDTASWPLDIEPLHSRSVYLAIAVSPVPLKQLSVSRATTLKEFGYLIALDVHGRCLAKVALETPIPIAA